MLSTPRSRWPLGWLTGLILLTLTSCRPDAPVAPDPVDPDPDPAQPQQYGLPFAGVPAIADLTIYEVNPRVFSSAQTLAAIRPRLDSLAELGVNVVWLMPTYPTGTERSVGSPYAVRNYLEVHPDYGTLADLRSLVAEAHRLGMAVILDWVANHTAWDHPWIDQPGWYVQDATGRIIHPPGTNWQDVAELNYDNAEMRAAMIAAMKYWVLEANVDGYRCDYAVGVPTSFWREAIDSLRAIPGRDLILFAEADDKALLGAGFDLLFGWHFYGLLREVYRNNRPAQALLAAHQAEYQGLASGQEVVRWTTNHDENAWDDVPQRLFPGEEAAFGAFVLASTMGGVPLVYNGQEVGESRRLPFFEGQSVAINWAGRADLKARYQALLQHRQAREALRNGSLTAYHTPSVMAFTRIAGSDTVFVAVNMRNSPMALPLPASLAQGSWTRVLAPAQPLFEGDTLHLPAYAAEVLAR